MSARDELAGGVVRPGDDDYGAARASWNLLVSHEPALIVFVQTAQDVVHVGELKAGLCSRGHEFLSNECELWGSLLSDARFSAEN